MDDLQNQEVETGAPPPSPSRRVWGGEFQRLVRGGESPSNLFLLCESPEAEIRAVDGDSDLFEVIVSSEMIDRYGDRILQDGIDLSHYRKNPVVLYGHSHATPPIARAENVYVEGVRKKRLIAHDRFAPDTYPLAKTVKELVIAKFMRGVSIGGLPLEVKDADDKARKFGYDIVRMDKYEHSFVNVGANPEALRRGAAEGIDIDPLMEHAESVLKAGLGEGFWLETARAEQVVKELGGSKGLKVFEVDMSRLRKGAGEETATLSPAPVALTLDAQAILRKLDKLAADLSALKSAAPAPAPEVITVATPPPPLDDAPSEEEIMKATREVLESSLRDAIVSKHGFIPRMDTGD